MLSGVYTILQKNPDYQDFYGYTVVGLFLLQTFYPKNLDLFGYSSQEISSTLSLVNRINLIDTGVGVIHYCCIKSLSGEEPQEFSTLGKILYVALYAFSTLLINSALPGFSKKMDSFDPGKVLMIMSLFSLTDGMIREVTRRVMLSSLKNEAGGLEPNSLDLAQNTIHQAKYLYSGEEKNTLLKNALDIYKKAPIPPPPQYWDSQTTLYSLLRKECFTPF